MALIKGTGQWCKITTPVPTYSKDNKEWTFELEIDSETKKQMVKWGLGKSVKVNKAGNDFVRFSRKVFKKDGTPSKPLEIIDAKGRPWDNSVKIGNGSTLNVQFAINEGDDKINRIGLIKVQVWDLVEYEGGGKDEFDEFPIAAGDDEIW